MRLSMARGGGGAMAPDVSILGKRSSDGAFPMGMMAMGGERKTKKVCLDWFASRLSIL